MIKLDEKCLWFDAPRSDLKNSADRIARYFDTVSISLNAGTGNVAIPTWNKKDLEFLTKYLNDKGVTTRWMIYPKANSIDETLKALVPLYSFMGEDAPVPDLDLEENAHGFNKRLADKLISGLVDFSPNIAINLVPSGKGVIKEFAQVFVDNDAVMLTYIQSYLQYQLKKTWTHDVVFRPNGRYLDVCADVAERIERPGMIVGMGMIMANQNHPDPHQKGDVARKFVYERLKKEGRPIGFWSRASLPSDKSLDFIFNP